jgi:hypothetical protein
MGQRIAMLLIALAIVPMFFVTRNFFVVFTQSREDKTEKNITKSTFAPEPIQILLIESDGSPVDINQRFVREGEWLKDFTVQFRNVSDKSIRYISLVIGFPETDQYGPRLVDFLRFGSPREFSEKTEEVITLDPGEIGQLKLTPEHFASLKRHVETKEILPNLSKIHLTLMAVDFDDGTRWSAGDMFSPDPARPGQYILIKPKKVGGKQ